ncbi:hypothetical protein M431DRAFT_508799 [Trichoderma harzianum CBS 226.95]|uniref:Uncharacterized protein n=1 Tax=Trichoderma harzianum CBS 226.95 TaxID=983964 RepID=A0A2T4A9F0_TRIHA|nr:hypothetical protein M431DRAFT_508799 [Trichoderma harzianum CBS 226.95]PTB53715.1 hypothetical protein M431DRAFT_508799 [Trichoderma harzianum CBS 226.95]
MATTKAPVSALCVLALTRRRFLTIPHNPGGFAPSGCIALRVVTGSIAGEHGGDVGSINACSLAKGHSQAVSSPSPHTLIVAKIRLEA